MWRRNNRARTKLAQAHVFLPVACGAGIFVTRAPSEFRLTPCRSRLQSAHKVHCAFRSAKVPPHSTHLHCRPSLPRRDIEHSSGRCGEMNSCGALGMPPKRGWCNEPAPAGAYRRHATRPSISEALYWLHFSALHCTNFEKSPSLPLAVLGRGQGVASHARGERQRKCSLGQQWLSHPNPTRVVTYDRCCAHLMIGLKGQNNRAQG